MQKFVGSIDITAPGPVIPFTIAGEASHLGKFTSVGEVVFTPGAQSEHWSATAWGVLTAANGDLLVGVVTWDVGAANDDNRSAGIHFSRRDSVTFSDGTVASNTGRFVSDRPPGLVVIAIIAILIGYCCLLCKKSAIEVAANRLEVSGTILLKTSGLQ